MDTKTEFYTFGTTDADKLQLQAGGEFGPVTVAYETYGKPNADKSNVILLFHALTGSRTMKVVPAPTLLSTLIVPP